MPPKTTAPAAKRQPVSIAAGRPVIHHGITVCGVPIPPAATVITPALARQILGWEDEDAYAARLMKANPKLKPEQCKFRDPDDKAGWADPKIAAVPAWDMLDLNGKPIKLWNNCRNRPFDAEHSAMLRQVILNKGWAGPSGCGDTLNGEPVIVGATGIVISGQHTLYAVATAEQEWTINHEHWSALWPDGPPQIEKLVVCGVAETQNILKTLDNIRPRRAADTFATSDLYCDLPPKGKQECSRMLEAALKMLWKRLGCADDKYEHYQTIDASYNLLARHPRLNDVIDKVGGAIKAIFDVNADRQLSKLKLSAGQCAAAMYLMGVSGSDFDGYYNAEKRDESVLDFSRWEKAEEFFTLLAAGEDFDVVRKALGDLFVPGESIGGRVIEKLAVLAKAWQAFGVEGRNPTVDDCSLADDYDRDVQGNITGLSKAATFGGIDRGEKPEPIGEEEVPPAEVEKTKAQLRKERAAEMVNVRAKSDRIPTGAQQLRDEINALKDWFPARPLITKHGALYRAYFEDAERIAKALDRQYLNHPDGSRIQFSPDEIEEVVAALRAKRINVACCDKDGNELFAAPATPPATEPTRKPAPKANGKAASKPPTRKPVAKK